MRLRCRRSPSLPPPIYDAVIGGKKGTRETFSVRIGELVGWVERSEPHQISQGYALSHLDHNELLRLPAGASTEYGVRKAEYGVESTKYGTAIGPLVLRTPYSVLLWWGSLRSTHPTNYELIPHPSSLTAGRCCGLHWQPARRSARGSSRRPTIPPHGSAFRR
jgi:hypothetical protein